MEKITGTALPIRSLLSRSDGLRDEPHGTFRTVLPFIDWLKSTGQHAWQMLPLSQTHLEPGSVSVHVPSPYKGYGVGLDPAYLHGTPAVTPDGDELAEFRLAQAEWLPDYALFCAIRNHLGTDRWMDWPTGLRDRSSAAIRTWSRQHADDIAHQETLQWRAHRAFAHIRDCAESAGIRLIGDLPFYLPVASPLVWAYRECFKLATDGSMPRVSGVPDSPKAHFGRQVWGHPLYAWSAPGTPQAALRVWKIRLDYHAALYDHMRLDHAKGLFRYGSIDPTDPGHDTFESGPGSAALEDIVLHARRSGLALFAEDSGDWLDELRATLRQLHVPGIRILRFAYNERHKEVEPNYADVAHYPEDGVAFTSTHDTAPLVGYVNLLDQDERRLLCARVGITYDGSSAVIAGRLRDALLTSPAHICILPLQDWLLTSDQINVPGTEKPTGDENWRYRMTVPIEDLPMDPC